ncbi:MAG: hypothetical protein H7338_17585 [Candidatus Sericytochromatia bacterium]|nr:hypothetical protein [Candidatus Sericytochromatia bacterium]
MTQGTDLVALLPLERIRPRLAKYEGAVRARATILREELPARVEGAIRNSVSAAAASMAADQISKRLLSRGTVPAVIAGLAGAALSRSVVESGFQLAHNYYLHRPWNEDVAQSAVDGLRRGAVNGGLTMLAKPIIKGMTNKFGQLDPVKLAMATGAVRGTLGGAVGAATNPEVWEDGAAKGAKRVAISTVRGAVGGAVSSAVSLKTSKWAHGKFDKYIDFTSVGQTWFGPGSAGGGGSNPGGGFFWRLVFGGKYGQ